MSRRITFFMLAAAATLIATQASADRECFEASCQLPEAVEPMAWPIPPAAADDGVGSEASAPLPKLTPAKALPQVVATPEVAPPQAAAEPVSRQPLPPLPRRAADASEPMPLAPRPVKQAAAPVRAAYTLPADEVRAEPAAPPVNYRANRAAAAAVVVEPGAIYAEDDVVRVYPHPRHDPAWKLCQLDRRERDQRRCGAYSYHPYGSNGYRPYGTYLAERGAPVYMLAPNAKIISIDSDD